MGKPENYVEGYLVSQAKANNFLCFKFLSGHNGVPDRLLIGNGKVFFIETKSKTGKPTRLQEAIHKLIRAQGLPVFVPNTREKVDEIFEEMIRGNP